MAATRRIEVGRSGTKSLPGHCGLVPKACSGFWLGKLYFVTGHSVIAIIPARGGSKGVPLKNLQRVGGVSLIGRAIQSARASPLIRLVVVSTDDVRIATEARVHGATVVDRPPELSGDQASSESALVHALAELEKGGEHADIVVFIQATSPFIAPASLDEGVRLIASGQADSVFAAVKTYAFLWERSGDDAIGVNHDRAFRQRRQDREPHFEETGAFYGMDAAGFAESGFRFFGRVGIVEVEQSTAFDVDTPADLEIARSLASLAPSLPGIDFSAVQAVVTDFDGVHTNDRAILDQNGHEAVTVSRSDGIGVELLRKLGLPVLVISKERNPEVTSRAHKLRVDVAQGIDDKWPRLQEWAKSQHIEPTAIAYIGNGVNDLGCMEAVGFPAAVSDAHPDVIAAARIRLERCGGDGAVWELANLIFLSQDRNPKPEEQQS